MFDPNVITTSTTQQSQIQYQQNEKDKNGQEKQQDNNNFAPFCYANVNMIQKITSPQNQHSTVNMSQLAEDSSKCYITQPAFGYNYTLLMPSQVQQAAAAAAAASQQQPTQIQLISADRIRFSCDECGMAFTSQADLKSHRLQSHQQQQAQQNVTQSSGLKIKNCETCGAPLPQDTNKKRAVMKVKCENCLSAETIQQPQIFVVAAAPETSAVKFEENSTGTQTSQSNLGTQNSIPIGVKNHHPVKRRGIASVTKCTKCNGSGIIFIGGAKNQQNNVDKPFHCNICNGSFSRYSSLWSHKRLHTGEKNFKCNICGLAFAKAAYLKNHSRIHTGEKPYRCSVCGMQFSQSPHLKNHERIHSGERPYICEVCDKSFARHSTLWNHRRIHTGEKPYRCDICNSCFNQATHLKNHQKVHSGEKPFKCDICSVGFSDRFALKRHRNIHEKYNRTKQQMNQATAAGQLQNNQSSRESSSAETASIQSAVQDGKEYDEFEAKFEPKFDEQITKQ